MVNDKKQLGEKSFFSFFVVHFMPETKFFDLCVESICHIFFLNNDPSFNILGQTLEPWVYCLERCQNLLNLCDDNVHTEYCLSSLSDHHLFF